MNNLQNQHLMELTEVNKGTKAPWVSKTRQLVEEVVNEIEVQSPRNSFIEANTIPATLSEITQGHIIPVFIKDNEPVISHTDFIQTALRAVKEVFHDESVLSPDIRISHPVKGRIPEARNKPAKELSEHEKTIYYERMAFTIEIPSVNTMVDDNSLNLTIGGVKAYNLDNLYSKSGVDQHFKIFIGFKNTVCTNLCVSTDGYMANVKVKNTEQLYNAMYLLFKDYNAVGLYNQFQLFSKHHLTERQFATLLGRCRMYRHMPEKKKGQLPELMFGDTQINAVCKDYYSDNSFCSSPDGSINLWKLYNLFTNANKSSYVDYLLDRNVNAFQLVEELLMSLVEGSDCWYLN